jgi:hypothetical protein
MSFLKSILHKSRDADGKAEEKEEDELFSTMGDLGSRFLSEHDNDVVE